MDRNTQTMSPSDHLNPDHHKRVHWALDLEEIVYFTPSFECEETKEERPKSRRDSILKKLKTKTHALKSKGMTAFVGSCDGDLLDKLQQTFERIVTKNSKRCGMLNIEDLNDLNKYWDELFELYGGHKPIYQKLA